MENRGIKRGEYFSDYKRTDTLVKKRVISYLPSLIITSMSGLLFSAIDGLILGGFEGNAALSAIALMAPLSTLFGAVCLWINSGFQIHLTRQEGKADIAAVERTYKAAFILTVIVAVLLTVIKLPLLGVLIKRMNVSEEVLRMTWSYAIGTLLASPVSVLTTFGTYIFIALGKFDFLLVLSVIEGVANAGFSYLLAYPMGFGIIGVGFGSFVAAAIRLIITIVYLKKKTNIIHRVEGPCIHEMKQLLSFGTPRFFNNVALAVQNYYMVVIITDCFASEGAAVRTVLSFCTTLMLMIINGVCNASFPLYGIKTGMKDIKGKKTVARNALKLDIIWTGILAILLIALPIVPFALHGFYNPPEFAILSLRIFAVYLFVRGINSVLREIMTNNGLKKQASLIVFFDNVILPVPFAIILSGIAAGKYLWAAYLFASLIALVPYAYYCIKIKEEEDAIVRNNKVLFLSSNRNNATELAEKTGKFLVLNGISESIANKVSMCIEEMVVYARPEKKDGKVESEITVNADGEDIHIGFMDDGIKLTEIDENMDMLEIGNNYRFVRSIAKEVTYQRVLNLNYTLIHL